MEDNYPPPGLFFQEYEKQTTESLCLREGKRAGEGVISLDNQKLSVRTTPAEQDF